MSKEKQQWDKWEEYEKLKMSMLKNIYLSQRATTSFMCEIWAAFYKKPMKQATDRFTELFNTAKSQFNDFLFAEHGSINLKDILPEEPPS